MTSLRVIAAGPLTTVQDRGRPGYGALGVSPSGAADRQCFLAANRVVGNADAAACLEVTLGGLVVEAHGDVVVAVTGADCADLAPGTPHVLRDGDRLRLRTPATGVRTYVAVRGGFDVPSVLGSRSTDVLGGIGPPAVAAGDVLPVGAEVAGEPTDVPLPAVPPDEVVVVRIEPGPRDTGAEVWERITSSTYDVSPDSNRVAVRLRGAVVPITGDTDSEGLVVGAVQVPPDGAPIVFLADHPVTGGYPVVAVVAEDDVRLVAQRRPGQRLAFAAM